MTTKHRIAVPANEDVHGPLPPKIAVRKSAPGAVTWVDKLKGYYKGLVAAVGSLLIILNQLTPLFNFLPGQDKGYVTAAIAVLTSIATFLTENQHWVDDA